MPIENAAARSPARAHRRCARRAARRGDARHVRVLPDARAHLARADRQEGLLASSPSKATGRTPRASTTTSGISNIRRPNGPRSRASRPGCGATTRCAPSSTGCARTTAGRSRAQRVAFHGLDLYSLYNSIRSVLQYLDEVDPATAQVARERYGCLTPWQSDPATYGHAALTGQLPDLRDARSSAMLHRPAAASGAPTPSTTASASSTPCRTRASSPTPSAITASCTTARARPGICATATCSRR